MLNILAQFRLGPEPYIFYLCVFILTILSINVNYPAIKARPQASLWSPIFIRQLVWRIFRF